MLQSIFESTLERGACGVGFVARVTGRADHFVVRTALHAVRCLEHRGAVAADGKSGDGAGILTEIPRLFFARELEQMGLKQEAGEVLCVGMIFIPQGDRTVADVLTAELENGDFRVIGWRRVPVDYQALGTQARASAPEVWQVFAAPVIRRSTARVEYDLHRVHKAFERTGAPGYICSLSCQTIVYKALCTARQIGLFYPDLCDPLYESALAVYHQRYSTNTLPSWEMVQPFRMLAHNGEINTLWGNRTWMRVREAELPPELCPVLTDGQSDSAALDAALVMMRRTGRGLMHAMSMLVTPAWEDTDDALATDVRAFYHAHAPLIEPWDGPAALAFSDGHIVGAALDRNGLRPCRYIITSDGLVVAGSEVGIVDIGNVEVIEKGRLGPGQMFAVDLVHQRILRNPVIRRRLTRFSAQRWRAISLPEAAEPPQTQTDTNTRLAFGLSQEELRIVLPPMVEDSKDAVWSMGDDAPIPPLSALPLSLYPFFRQRFAQVTNPPIDSLREGRVMSLRTWLGARPPLVARTISTPLIELKRPLLSGATFRAITAQTEIPHVVIDCSFDANNGDLREALNGIADRAEAAARVGIELIVLSDRAVNNLRAPLPMALAVGIVHHRLVDQRLRARAGIIVEAGDCRDVHHAAVLIACGATVIHPWLALEVAREIDAARGEERLLDALCAGLLKVMSKIGISTIASYRGAQHLEALGLATDVVNHCFAGMPSTIEGLGFDAIAMRVREQHASAYVLSAPALADFGRVRFRRAAEAEHHAWSPGSVRALQASVGSARATNLSPDDAWRDFRLSSSQTPSQIRHLLDIRGTRPEIALDEVEAAATITRRFVSSAMSLGALSPEAHATLTIAMNRLGARSNSGEGGENPELYRHEGPDRLDNKIKQVASGRFGVTAEYLARADELEIKIAQGSKPGEGGQLPGHKVTELIARLRHSQPGVSLISPPPHHDIYSIEDLAQLIYDLKRINPTARVGVKLVAEYGIGTIASGVAKAYADYIVISGHSGGTGASPLSSIKHAGAPWELGLADAQRSLVTNHLRDRVTLRTDGGIVSARDIMVAAMLGAEEFGFGTSVLVALGCDMARQCHLDSCPTGIASQRPELRAKFRGKPENVTRYLLRLAEDVRALLARLGLARLDDVVGRFDMLHQIHAPNGIRLDGMLRPYQGGSPRSSRLRNDPPARADQLNDRIFADSNVSVQSGSPVRLSYRIGNADRTIGARISGAIASRWGNQGLPANTIRVSFDGSAGQSFGAFCANGMTLTLTGDANDYVGKGLSGGRLIIKPVGAACRAPHRNVIIGNVALYGATAGHLYAAGRAGERFAVRNSGATAVIEGVGDHGCEYMTGGRVLILGRTGWNFGAGMSGGIAYVFDRISDFPVRANAASVIWARAGDHDAAEIRALLQDHVRCTGSVHAERILRAWATTAASFWVVTPRPSQPPVIGSQSATMNAVVL